MDSIFEAKGLVEGLKKSFSYIPKSIHQCRRESIGNTVVCVLIFKIHIIFFCPVTRSRFWYKVSSNSVFLLTHASKVISFSPDLWNYLLRCPVSSVQSNCWAKVGTLFTESHSNALFFSLYFMCLRLIYSFLILTVRWKGKMCATWIFYNPHQSDLYIWSQWCFLSLNEGQM